MGDENKRRFIRIGKSTLYAFGVTSGLEIYCWPLFKTEDVIVKPVEGEQVIYEWINKIEDRIMQCGFPFGKMIKDVIATYQCMADGGDSILVFPEGKLGGSVDIVSYLADDEFQNPQDRWPEFNRTSISTDSNDSPTVSDYYSYIELTNLNNASKSSSILISY